MFGIRLHLPLFDTIEIPDLLRMIVTPHGHDASVEAAVYAPGGTTNWTDTVLLGFSNNILFSEETEYDNLTQSTFNLYYGLAPVWRPVYPGVSGQPALYATWTPHWHVVGDPADKLLCGVFFTDTSLGTVVYAGVSLPEPVALFPGLIIPVSVLLT